MAPRLTKGAHFSIVIALYILLLDYHSGQSAPTRVTRWTGSESLALLKTASSFIDPQIANLPNAAVGSILPTNEKRKKKERAHLCSLLLGLGGLLLRLGASTLRLLLRLEVVHEKLVLEIW